MRKLQEAQLDQKKVLVRADLDVKLDPLDDFRLKALLPTLTYLKEKNCKIILTGHIDRPNGKVIGNLRTLPIAPWLRQHQFIVEENTKVLPVSGKVKQLPSGSILLLENLRFDPREKENDQIFAKALAKSADLFVNDAFGSSHRQHASVVAVTKFLPSFAGIHLQKEVEVLSGVLKNPPRPLVFIMGGAKSETKIPLVKAFSNIADAILLGGTLMFAQTLEGVPKIKFAVDAIHTQDIGPRSIKLFRKYIHQAQTIVWNGPLGKFEEKKFAEGTKQIAKAVLDSSANIIIGGGDTIDALKKFNLLAGFQKSSNTFLSTGGGAMLSFLAQEEMPGLKALGFKYNPGAKT